MTTALATEPHGDRSAAAASSGIVWLASYPKSGNTWMRALLTAYRRGPTVGGDLTAFDTAVIASARAPVDYQLGVESGEVPPATVERLRPRVYEAIAEQVTLGALPCNELDMPSSTDSTLEMIDPWPHIHKAHDAWHDTDTGEPLFAPTATSAAIYLVRNPLDVAVSYAHYSGHGNYDKSIASMADTNARLARSRRRQHDQLPQRLGTWSDHLRSWVERAAEHIPVLVVRYEDLHADTAGTFERVIEFLGVLMDQDRLEAAVAASSFDTLRQSELTHGFRECPPLCDAFFRRGRIGDWRDELTDDQVARVVGDHHEVMERFGYCPADTSQARESPTTQKERS